MTLPTYSQAMQKRWLYPELWASRAGAWCPSIQGGGSTLFDFSGTGSTISLTNTTWVNNSLRFTNASSSYGLGTLNRNPTTFPFTLSCWFNQATTIASGTAMLLTLQNSTPTGAVNLADIFTDQNNAWRAGFNGTSNLSLTNSSPLVVNGVWNHIAGVYLTTGAVQLYCNGVFFNVSATNSFGASGGTFSKIGLSRFGSFAGDYFDGYIDDAAIWKRALSKSEVADLYSLGRGGVYAQRGPSYNWAAAVGGGGGGNGPFPWFIDSGLSGGHYGMGM